MRRRWTRWRADAGDSPVAVSLAAAVGLTINISGAADVAAALALTLHITSDGADTCGVAGTGIGAGTGAGAAVVDA